MIIKNKKDRVVLFGGRKGSGGDAKLGGGGGDGPGPMITRVVSGP